MEKIRFEIQQTLWLITFLTIMPGLYSQNWNTFAGNSARSGNSKITGPSAVEMPYWIISDASSTLLGQQVYSFGDFFVNARVGPGFSTVKIECRNLQDGSLRWISPFISSNSKLYCIGISEDAVYGCDYATDSVYAFKLTDGSLKWTAGLTSYSYGARESVVFACNGDIILNGPGFGGPTTMRINNDDGSVVWGNDELFAVSPVGALAAYESVVYRIIGAINQPIRLAAIDIDTGVTLRISDPLPGDGDQENQLFLSDNQNILFWRDNGSLHSFADDGNQLIENWHYSIASPPTGSNNSRLAFGQDGHVYTFDGSKIIRLNHQDGSLMNETTVALAAGSLSIGADSTVYFSNENNAVSAFSFDLQQQLWQIPFNNNAFGNTPLSKDGIMVLAGAGSTLKAFRPDQDRKPVADFSASTRKTGIGQPLSFTDQSSYLPTNWEWSFERATINSSTDQNPAGILWTSPGIYKVSLSVSNSFGSDSLLKNSYIEVVDQGVGLDDRSRTEAINFTPNPADGYTILKLNCRKGGIFSVSFSDLTGKVLMKSIIDMGVAGNCQIRFPTSEIPEGMWLVGIFGSDGFTAVGKLMVSH